jgi:serine/threonine protein kinase
VTTPDRWQDVERLYHAALARDERERAAFLRDACRDDEDLRREVESLLGYDRAAHDFMAPQALDAAAAALIHSEHIDAPLVGRRLGSYDITSLLGAGGMGEVYRARDSRLGRDVAIKILPEAFAADPDRRARFEREARLLAALNHPHIAAVYGFEDYEGLHALVLELVEGQTLAERLRRGPLPVAEAITIARQIADALEAAHHKGIVHRDLKPANISLGPNDAVKVLDFGLAKVRTHESTPEFADSPTVMDTATHESALRGTAPYMSPEQLRGQPVDKRSDIWAFGCVLWETLVGRRPFRGETLADATAAILHHEPDWQSLPPSVPAGVTKLLRRCLQKDPQRRLHDIADARIEIDEALESGGAGTPTVVLPSRRVTWQRIATVASLVVAVAAIAAAVVLYVRASPEITTPTRLSVSTPGTISPQLSATISPDGRQLAFVSTGGSGKLMLWIRALDALEARVLPGTENAAHPFWSPDGRSIGFQADGKIRTIDAAGISAVQTLADSLLRAGATWGRDNLILFIPRAGELATVPADGGPISPVLSREMSRGVAMWPHFLPDGRHFLYASSGSRPEERGIYVGSLDSKETKQVLQSDFKAAYASGYLVSVRGETVIAQPFDLERLEVTGQPARVADGVWGAAGARQASFSVSQTGVLAYVNAAFANIQLRLFDRAGRSVGLVGPPARHNGTPQLSPDGQRVAMVRDQHIWLLDVYGQSTSRITFGPLADASPIWSRDGSRLAFRSNRPPQGWGVYTVNASGAGSEELLFVPDRIVSLEDWSADGRFIVYTAAGKQSQSDLWLAPLFGDRRPRPFLETAFNKSQAQVSPDSRWIAYTSYESGKDEVYVQSFPEPGSKRQISSGGGVQPRWRRDGKELFYLTLDQRLMAVPLSGGPTFEPGTPTPLFKTRSLPHGSQSIGLSTCYDVSPDGQRFVSCGTAEESGPPITVVLNWTAILK